MYVEIPDDDVISGDTDKDWVLDFNDQCPSSPPGIPVDSTGCPLDSDRDGTPDYLDKEINSPPEVSTDEEGSQINASLVHILGDEKGASLTDYDYYLRTGNVPSLSGNKRIPAKFREADLDHNGEISFDELLKTIDRYFDYQTILSLQDIYELMDFYFTQ